MNESDAPTRTLVYEEEDITASRNLYLTPDGQSLDGPGALDGMLVVVTDSYNFGVRVETATTTLVDDDFSRLSTFSVELEHVSAYTMDSGNRVISVTDFPYRQMIRAEVTVSEQLTIDWIRAVYTIGREVDY